MHSSNSISILRVYTSVERLYSRVTHKHGCMHTCMWCTKSITTLVASSYHLATRVVSQFTNSCRATCIPASLVKFKPVVFTFILIIYKYCFFDIFIILVMYVLKSALITDPKMWRAWKDVL